MENPYGRWCVSTLDIDSTANSEDAIAILRREWIWIAASQLIATATSFGNAILLKWPLSDGVMIWWSDNLAEVSLSVVCTFSPLQTWKELLKCKLERILTFAAGLHSFSLSFYLSLSDPHYCIHILINLYQFLDVTSVRQNI